MDFLLLYSEIIPTIFAVAGIYFMLSGGLEENRIQLVVGIALFVLAVLIPFVSLSILV
ncbi:MAG: hypothetical protein IJI98_05790 [Methanosphaera sp.]|uniref:hypothetical protein n=1 Tax=Methanosphaera sp. ISO3-F5 TaxID=1452353 RepID=UPI002B2608E4|nr:hypothetical protein [Methanosphaera sp. ISO3-F5]MBR0472192.1 hypothetical protein [Methanosphaera sp.]WQH64458.1 hypothetical protein PXD04_01285 [Methanosphaera sp. ISO3-F5]